MKHVECQVWTWRSDDISIVEQSLFGFGLWKINYFVRLRKVVSVRSLTYVTIKNKSLLTRSQTGCKLQPAEGKSDVLALYTSLKGDARALTTASKLGNHGLIVHLTLWQSFWYEGLKNRWKYSEYCFFFCDSAIVRCRSVSSDVSTGTHVKWIIMVLRRAIKSQKTLMSGESMLYSELTVWHLFHDTTHPLR